MRELPIRESVPTIGVSFGLAHLAAEERAAHHPSRRCDPAEGGGALAPCRGLFGEHGVGEGPQARHLTSVGGPVEHAMLEELGQVVGDAGVVGGRVVEHAAQRAVGVGARRSAQVASDPGCDCVSEHAKVEVEGRGVDADTARPSLVRSGHERIEGVGSSHITRLVARVGGAGRAHPLSALDSSQARGRAARGAVTDEEIVLSDQVGIGRWRLHHVHPNDAIARGPVVMVQDADIDVTVVLAISDVAVAGDKERRGKGRDRPNREPESPLHTHDGPVRMVCQRLPTDGRLPIDRG